MSLFELDRATARAGNLVCGCGLARENADQATQTWRLAAAYGAAIFSQTLALAGLALAGGYLAPTSGLATLPFAANFLGSACASFPASLLLDKFGRRAAFALGASLGMAGGILSTHAILIRQFPELCMGAFWIGAAQGFALFFRHAAAGAGVGGSRSALVVLAGGAGGAILAPLVIFVLRTWSLAGVEAWMPAMSAGGNLLVLLLALALPHSLNNTKVGADRPDGGFFLALSLGTMGWFAMARAMSQAPLALMGCGFAASAVTGATALHVLAMYAPMAAAALGSTTMPTFLALVGGLSVSLLSLTMPWHEGLSVLGSLLSAALGWSFLQIVACRLLYDGARRSFAQLSAYDALTLASALAGVFYNRL